MRMFRYVVVVGTAALAVGILGCTVSNYEVHGAYADAAIRNATSPMANMMFDAAFKAMPLPEGAVAEGDYIGIYKLSSGKGEDPWWVYLAEDALVAKCKKVGANVVERNLAANGMLTREGEYVSPPRKSEYATAPKSPKDDVLTPYRATRALEYRVVTAAFKVEPVRTETSTSYPAGTTIITEDAIVTPGAIITEDAIIAGPYKHHREAGAVKVTCQINVNLRTVDVRTGEVLWSGPAVGIATQKIPVSALYPYLRDFEDGWDEDYGPWYWWWNGYGGNATYGTEAPCPPPPPPTAGDSPEMGEPAPASDAAAIFPY